MWLIIFLSVWLAWSGPAARMVSISTALALGAEWFWGFNWGLLSLSWLAVILIFIVVRRFLNLPTGSNNGVPGSLFISVGLGLAAFIIFCLAFGILSWQIYQPELGFVLPGVASQPFWFWYTLLGLVIFAVVFELIRIRHGHF